jgi:hypothetical protein
MVWLLEGIRLLVLLLWLILKSGVVRPIGWTSGPEWVGVVLLGIVRMLLVRCLGLVVLSSIRLGKGVDY